MTVDWGNWLTKTPAEQAALWSQYRTAVAMEIHRAKSSGWRRLDFAIRFPVTWRRQLEVRHG